MDREREQDKSKKRYWEGDPNLRITTPLSPGPTCRKCHHPLNINMKCTNKNCPNYDEIGWK